MLLGCGPDPSIFKYSLTGGLGISVLISAMTKERDALVGSYFHLAKMPRANEALRELQKIASLVKPIMRNRSWHIGTLAEFFPDQKNLLGMCTDFERSF